MLKEQGREGGAGGLKHLEGGQGPVSEIFDQYPPPYRLDCDLAIFPLTAWPLQFLLAARYRHALYGPSRAHLECPYQEITWMRVRGIGWPLPIAVPALWVDSKSSVPLELGWRYGFPKVAAKVSIADDPACLAITGICDPASLRIECRMGPALPATLFRLAIVEAVFPAQLAWLRLTKVETARFVTAHRWAVPRAAAPLFGFWLTGVELALSAPQRRA